MKNKEFDWFKWAGINESEIDKLYAEAKKYNIQIFDADTKQDIFNRILTVRTFKSNKNFFLANLFFAAVSCVSAVVSVIYAIH